MNIVVLSGHLSSTPRRTELPSGDERWVLELSCPTDPSSPVPSATAAGESVVLSVPVAVNARVRGIDQFDTGTELIVIGVVRRRFFRAGGSTQSRTEVVAQSVLEVTPRRPAERALASAMRAVGADQATRLRAALPAAASVR
jgi:single-strand DNA-binding protein